jgi:hypothetical protein
MDTPEVVDCPVCGADAAVLERARADSAFGVREGDVLKLRCPTDGELARTALLEARRDGWSG